MKTIKDISIEDVKDLFDSIIFFRGKEYFDSGCVKLIEPLDSLSIAGIVRGNENYNVNVSIDSDGDIVCECSCPCDFKCKHAAALLLKWVSIKNKYNKEIKEGKAEKIESLKDILDKKRKEELIELMTEFIRKYPDLKSLVKIDRKEIAGKIRDLFSDFWDWNEVNNLISQLETILEGIRRDRSSWEKEMLKEMEICSEIMVKGQENVHDEGDYGFFLEEWFRTYGEMFSYTKPSKEEKEVFLKKILEFIEKDDYGLESSFEEAFLGMCNSKEDIEMIKKFYKPSNKEDEDYDEDIYEEFYLKLYNKIGLDEEYIKTSRKHGFVLELIEKLIVLGKLEEALKECEKAEKTEDTWLIQPRKVEILKKLDRKDEYKNALLDIAKKSGDISYVLRLKNESEKNEWKSYLDKLISDSKEKNRDDFLSRIFFHENDLKNAFEYSKNVKDMDYLELLAKKLSTEYPNLACETFRKLCFRWIDHGSGWPYEKAGKMLESIKKLDENGDLYKTTKSEIIWKHGKKYSLMDIIRRV